MATTIPHESAAGKAEAGAEIRLYERWKKIYPRWVSGGFQRGRRSVLLLLLLIFYLSPWLTWNGRPAVWFNLPERKFVLLWATFWPQELVLFSWLLIIAAFALFFFTVIAGRLWCGWACPQTVWTLCYVWLEKWVEGDRNARIRLDRSPWNRHRIGKKLLKWSLWVALAASIAVTFEGYFVPIRELLPKIARFDLSGGEQFWLFFPAAASFLFSGVLREQVCFHMCPYARFQSVMFDRDTLIISYDEERGEPRGSRSRHADPASLAALDKGSCIDCKLCVSVCPTGIDIRDGLQYECIGCAACIDVCNDVMDKMGYEPNLIQYSSLHADRHERFRWLRPRLVGYGFVLAAMTAGFVWTISHRVPLGLDIIRDRARLYREHWDGSVENVYTVRIMNREQRDRTYALRAEADVPLELKSGRPSDAIVVEAGSQLSLPVRLIAAPGERMDTNTPVEFTVEAEGEPRFRASATSRFLSPAEPGAAAPG